ncbi:MAG: hypothetical protein JNL85_16325 [Rubrivivax sp.]|nr:hypothetical protein [Rubrivivax sp.]
MVKRVLVVARHNPVEALRVAAGLTLADASLSVVTLGPVPDTEEAQVQLEALAFAEVTPRALPTGPASWSEVARAIVDSDAVYML